MEFNHILHTVEKGVARISLNRPEVLNSFHRSMAREVQRALSDAHQNPQVRAVLLTAEGKAFCAGQDLTEVVSPDVSPMQDFSEIVRNGYNPIIRGIRNLEKPVICAVNGVAAGAGANIALACDVVFASRKAAFLQAFSKIGLVPDSGATFFLPRLVGVARATALMMLGDRLSAEDAFALGMVHKVCDPETLRSEAEALARHLAQQPTRALGLMKRALNHSFSNSLEEQLELEAALQGEAGRTADCREGIEAFLEKREPRFRGL